MRLRTLMSAVAVSSALASAASAQTKPNLNAVQGFQMTDGHSILRLDPGNHPNPQNYLLCKDKTCTQLFVVQEDPATKFSGARVVFSDHHGFNAVVEEQKDVATLTCGQADPMPLKTLSVQEFKNIAANVKTVKPLPETIGGYDIYQTDLDEMMVVTYAGTYANDPDKPQMRAIFSTQGFKQSFVLKRLDGWNIDGLEEYSIGDTTSKPMVLRIRTHNFEISATLDGLGIHKIPAHDLKMIIDEYDLEAELANPRLPTPCKQGMRAALK